MRTRASIMESALEIFGEKNFANASVSEITARIGLSKGAFYWHFKNKQDILIKIIEECCGESPDKTISLYETEIGALDPMREYFKNAMTRLRSEEHWKKIHKLMIRRYEWPEDIRERVDQIMHESTLRDVKMIASYIEARQKDGKIRESVSAEKTALLLTSIFHGIGILQLSGALPEDFPGCLDILFDALGKELAPEAGE